MENFGPDSNMSLYNCVYSHEELESVKKNEAGLELGLELGLDEKSIIQIDPDEQFDNLEQLRLFFPIIKLVVKEQENIIISSIAVKIEQEIVYDMEIDEWSLHWVSNSNISDYIQTLKLDKNINPGNILKGIIQHWTKNK